MPDIPASVQITRLVVGLLLALAVLGAATAGLLTGKLDATAFGGLVAGGLAAAGVGAVASSRRRKAPAQGGTTFVDTTFDPSVRLTDAEGRALRTKVGTEDPTPRGGSRARPGYLRVPGWYARLLERARPVAHRVAVEARALWEIARLRWLVCLAVLALAAPLVGCSGEQRVAQTTIVAMGGSVAAIHDAHREAYVEATDALRAEVRAQHGTIADYDRGAEPINRAFRARSEALQSLSASLYAAAAIVDTVQRGAPASQYASPAVDVIRALERVLSVLEAGGVLPAVPIPPEVRTALRGLEAVARMGGALLTPADAGSDGGAQ